MDVQERYSLAHQIVNGIYFRCESVEARKIINRTIELHGEVTVNAIAAVLRHQYVTPAYDATRKSIRRRAEEYNSDLRSACYTIVRRRVDGAVTPTARQVYANYLAQMEEAA
ncbi:MAG: hypothetical protein AAGA75_24945 [Cyanobacteria bacterium P01_E01_bin.6]